MAEATRLARLVGEETTTNLMSAMGRELPLAVPPQPAFKCLPQPLACLGPPGRRGRPWNFRLGWPPFGRFDGVRSDGPSR